MVGRRAGGILGLALLAGCGGGTSPRTGLQPAHNELTADERAAGWQLLFDGRTTDGWRGYRGETVPAGWQVVDGALRRVAEGEDIVTRETFGDFELSLEWTVVPGGNSGIMYRVTEEYDYAYKSGPEMQVLDDAGHPDGQSPLTAAGSVFGLYPTVARVAHPAGEWNQARVTVRRGHVEHWLNGVRVAEYEVGSPDWEARVAGSKFVQWPGFGRAAHGHIGLQNHGTEVAYRDIKVLPLP